MSPELWGKIEELYHAALERESHERASFLAQACESDTELLTQVEKLIAAHDQSGSFIDSPAYELATESLIEPLAQSLEGRSMTHYKIVSRIGRGGMGEVYLAHDTRLDRKVAIKFLSSESATDERARKRLMREAKAAAAFDHPNICTVHEVGHEGDHTFIVMQYVEGETLAERIKRKPLGLKESLDIGVQIANALTEAHSRGIIHRDIKPQNIMLTPRGQVKVLDFGLAKLIDKPQSSGSKMATDSLISQPGIIAGTVAYMSPEQVRGESLDLRTDIFSLGAVLYEMVCGLQPFAGENLGATISAILTREPAPLASYSREVPAELERIVSKALRKEKKERYQTNGELLIDIRRLKDHLEFDVKRERWEEPHSDSEPTTASETDRQTDRTSAFSTASSREPFVSRVLRYKKRAALFLRDMLSAVMAPPAGEKKAKWKLAAMCAGLALILVAALLWLSPSNRSSRGGIAPSTEWRVKEIANWRIKPTEGFTLSSFSPDGKLIALSAIKDGESGIWVKQIGGGDPRKVTGDLWQGSTPVWSPDSGQIAFLVGHENQSEIWTIPYLGGKPELVKRLDMYCRRLTRWSSDGEMIYFESDHNLYRANRASGEVIRLTDFDPQNSSTSDFAISPDETRIAYSMTAGNGFHIFIASMQGEEIAQVTTGEWSDSFPAWFPDGRRIIYSSDRAGVFQIFISAVDGSETIQVTFGENEIDRPDVSPDGKSLIFSSHRKDANVFSCNVETGQETELTSSFGLELWPDASPDGQRVVFQASGSSHRVTESSLFSQSLIQRSEPVLIAEEGFDPRWSPDGKTLAFLRSSGSLYDTWTVSARGGDERQITSGGITVSGFRVTPFVRKNTCDYQWSPDGLRIAYCSQKSGRPNLWAVRIDGSSDEMLTDGNNDSAMMYCPVWSPDGNSIAFLSKPATESSPGKRLTQVWVWSQGKSVKAFETISPLKLLGWSASGGEVYICVFDSTALSPIQNGDLIRISAGNLKMEKSGRIPDVHYLNVRLSPDRRFLVFEQRRDGISNLRMIQAGGGAAKKITGNTDPAGFFTDISFSPDSRTIFYSKQKGWYVVSMIENIN